MNISEMSIKMAKKMLNLPSSKMQKSITSGTKKKVTTRQKKSHVSRTAYQNNIRWFNLNTESSKSGKSIFNILKENGFQPKMFCLLSPLIKSKGERKIFEK